MIVKNESRIMERCLNATKSIVDFVSICDTGSTDHTPEIIENWCKENEILEQFIMNHLKTLVITEV